MVNNEVVSGIVIVKRDYQDSDALITAILESGQKFTFKAKGIMRLTSKNAAACQVFSQGEYTFVPSNNNYATLKTGKLIRARAHFFNSYSASVCAMIIAELIDKMTYDGRVDPQIYHLLNQSLTKLEESDSNPPIILIITILKLLASDGHQIVDDGCCCCGSKHNLESIDLGQGGLVCQNCREKGRPRFSREFLSCFYRLVRANFDNLYLLEINDSHATIILSLLFDHLESDCGLVVNSASYITSIFA